MRLKYLIAVPAIFLAAACKGNDDKKVDDALNNDLSLAAQPATPVDSISGVERGLTAGATAAPAAASRTTSAPVRRTTTTRRTASSGTSRSSGSSGTYYPAPAPAPTVQKHTQRDAAIGGVAGAVIGAATSRNKVK